MTPLTCEAAVRLASDQLTGLDGPDDRERTLSGMELMLSPEEGRERLAQARFAVRAALDWRR
ncbi:hypothetical protein [Kribbella sp. HUAS MG21]|uniref:Uncharacterized protein n=1 Tax=Kribbella sp. HUAS MG21 TaxID=3160966 RepID=A0AAU7TA71_9ACTN